MNFLLGASIIVLLLFPGFVARLMYLNTAHNRSFSFGMVEELLFSLVPTLFIHLICLPFTLLFDFKIDELYLMVISDKARAGHISLHSLVWFILYCLLTYFVAFWLGVLIQRVAMLRNWDINIPLFRIHNEWYYLLRGFFHTPPGARWRQFVKIEDVKIDAVVEIAGKSYIYSGYIHEFVLSRNEGLNRLYLRDTVRIPLELKKDETTIQSLDISGESLTDKYNSSDDTSFPDKEKSDPYDDFNYKLLEQMMRIEKESFYIPGDRLVLPFSEIKNMNISYDVTQEIVLQS